MTPLALTVVGVVLSGVSTSALGLGAWYFRQLNDTLGDLAKQVNGLHVVIARLETRDETHDGQLSDLKQRILALESRIHDC